MLRLDVRGQNQLEAFSVVACCWPRLPASHPACSLLSLQVPNGFRSWQRASGHCWVMGYMSALYLQDLGRVSCYCLPLEVLLSAGPSWEFAKNFLSFFAPPPTACIYLKWFYALLPVFPEHEKLVSFFILTFLASWCCFARINIALVGFQILWMMLL